MLRMQSLKLVGATISSPSCLYSAGVSLVNCNTMDKNVRDVEKKGDIAEMNNIRGAIKASTRPSISTTSKTI